MRHTAAEKYSTPGNRKKFTFIGSRLARTFLAGSQLAGALLGLPLQWLAHSRLTLRLHLAALPSTAQCSLLRCWETLLLLFQPPPLPHPSSSASKGGNRHMKKHSWNFSTPFVPPGESSVPTVVIFSYVHVTDLLGLLLESVNFQEIWFSRSLVPYSLLGVFIPAEHLVYCHHFLLWPISRKSPGQ